MADVGSLPLPAGYKRWNLTPHETMALPLSVIAELIREQKAEYLAQKAQASQPLTPSVPAAAPPSAPADWRTTWGATAERGEHRVLHHFDALHSGSFLADRRHRSADTEVGTRLKALVDELVRRGPDRFYGAEPNARQQLEALERTMPHFSKPLRVLCNAMALAGVAPRPVRVPPMLLLGPPGVGKTHFSQQVAEALGVPHAVVSFDNPSAGNVLRGSDKHWSNSSTGLLFEQLCLGSFANPVILLDELDKASVDSSHTGQSAHSQLHGVLEPVTARRTVDASVDIEFDASLVTYIATANNVRGIEPSILSRFEVFVIEPPEPRMAIETARHVAASALKRMGLEERMHFDRKCHYVLAHLTPRQMQRSIEKAVAAAVVERRDRIEESDLWREIGLPDEFVEPRH